MAGSATGSVAGVGSAGAAVSVAAARTRQRYQELSGHGHLRAAGSAGAASVAVVAGCSVFVGSTGFSAVFLFFPFNKPLSFAFKSDSAFGAGRMEQVSQVTETMHIMQNIENGDV